MLATLPSAFVAHGGFLLTSRRPASTAPLRTPPRCQATPPRRPNPPPTPPPEPSATPPTPPSAAPADEGPQLRAPRDPTALRSESEVRRNRPAKRVPRRRRRGADNDEPAIEWEKAESVPLVGGEGEGWVDLKKGARRQAEKAEKAERQERRRDEVDDAVIEKLKDEIVRPYNQNWIGILVVAIALLSIAFKLSGGFETIPIIPVPDL